jgi:hypothetical protein
MNKREQREWAAKTYVEKYPQKALKPGNIVEFWLERGAGNFDPKVSRWQVAEVIEIMDDVVMIVPWHCGHETLRRHDDLYRIAKSNTDYRRIMATGGKA